MSGRGAGWRSTGLPALRHSGENAATGHCRVRLSGQCGENTFAAIRAINWGNPLGFTGRGAGTTRGCAALHPGMI
jgi:hypothetical protein